MSVESVEVPFIKIGNRRCLTDEQLFENPYLAEFVERFKDSFEYDGSRSIHIFIERYDVV